MRFVSLPRQAAAAIGALLALSATACATGMSGPTPADIPRLRSAVASNPSDTELQVQLGVAEYKADDYEGARNTLTAALAAGSVSGPAFLYLGLAQEHFENWSAARDAYNRYLQVGTSDKLKGELRSRLELIGHNLLEQQAKQTLAREQELSTAAPTPRSIAIFPFGFNSDRADLQPLIYAISDMMITDFAVSNALTVLERTRVQSLLDEMALTDAGYAQPGTGARAGRMLRAEHVVQGVLTTVGQDELRIDDDVLDVANGNSVGKVDAEDQLQKLFDVEKDIVFRTLRDVLGIELTPAEEQRIRENRAQNILAFVAYGRGLRERDRGNFQAALEEFRRAQQLDPTYAPAAAAAAEAGDLTEAFTLGTEGIEQTASLGGAMGGGLGGPGIPGIITPPPLNQAGTANSAFSGGSAALASFPSSTLGGASEAVNPTPTSGQIDLGSTQSQGTDDTAPGTHRDDPAQESTGSDGVVSGSVAQIRLVIRRPGGGL